MNINDSKYWLRKTVKVEIDRPLNSAHPQFPKNIYPINYGYIPNTFSEIDKEEIDAYVMGPSEPIKNFIGKVIAVIVRTDDEIKLVVTDGIKYSNQDIRRMTDFQEKYHESSIIRQEDF